MCFLEVPSDCLVGKGLEEKAGWKPAGGLLSSLGRWSVPLGTEKQEVDQTAPASLRGGVEQPEVNEGGAGPVQLARARE